MKFKEFRYIYVNHNLAFQFFKIHLDKSGTLKKYTGYLVFILGFIKTINRISIISNLSRPVHSLLIGYASEIAWANQNKIEYDVKQVPDSMQNTRSRFEFFDYIIIGSGPGAAIAYSKLPKNAKILLVESGDASKTPENLNHSLLSLQNDFKDNGAEFILSRDLPQFAQGKLLGGGSEINSGLYHDLPDHLLTDFSKRCEVSTADWDLAQEKIRRILNLSLSEISLSNSLIARGASVMGLEFKNIPRWRETIAGCITQFGMRKLFWDDALNAGLQVELNCTVKRIDNSNKEYLQVIASTQNHESLVYKCKKVIVSAGTISTPQILRASGLLKKENIKFQWHPMIRVISKSKENDLGYLEIDPVQAWTPDKEIKFGNGVSTPGLLSVGLNRFVSNLEAKELRSYYASFKSSGEGGQVPLKGLPWYRSSYLDLELENKAKEMLTQIIKNGGGEIIPDMFGRVFKKSTVHIFGSLPIGSEVFINGSSKLRIDPRIQISDGSLLPKPPGVNPQGVIMTLCSLVVTA